MCTIKTEIDDLKGLTIQTVYGRVTLEELAAGIETFYSVNPTQMILWDFSEADASGIRADEVRILAEFTQRYLSLRKRGRTALVFRSDFAFGLGRMYDMTQNLAKTDVFYKSFRSKKEALEWLEEK